jgi:hypothetical protein
MSEPEAVTPPPLPDPSRRVWPVPRQEIPAKQARKLRAAFRRGSFSRGSCSPGDPRLARPLRSLALALAYLAGTGVVWLAGVLIGEAPVYLIIPLAILTIASSLLGLAVGGGILVYGIKRITVTGRAIVRWRGSYLLPDEFEPTEIAIVEAAAQLADRVSASQTAQQGRLAPVGGDMLLAQALWHIAEHARQVSALRQALGSGPDDSDEVLAAALAPAAAAVTSANDMLLARVAALAAYADLVDRADDAWRALARGREVGERSGRVAAIVANLDWDQPAVDDTALVEQIATLEGRWADRIADALAAAPMWT